MDVCAYELNRPRVLRWRFGGKNSIWGGD